MSTLHDLIVTGQIPPFEPSETLASWARRVYRAGVLDGTSWGLAQVAPISPQIHREEVVVTVPEENLSESESSEPGDGGVEDTLVTDDV